MCLLRHGIIKRLKSIMNTTKAFAGVVLGLALFASAAAPASAQTTSAQTDALWAQVRALQAQIALLRGGAAGVSFTSNMTIGSSGTEVSRLQSFLIGRGHVIPAGATGYFGVQTQAAVAAFQRANGVAPAIGYFGPLTRAWINAIIGASVSDSIPSPTSSDEDDAQNALNDLDSRIRAVQDDIDEAEHDGEDVDEANGLLDEARDLLDEANEAFDDGNYDKVMDLVEEAEELVKDALDEATVDDDTGGGNASTNATTSNVDGADNDYARFEITFMVEAFGEDIYIPVDGDDAFTYRIENASNGSVVTDADSESTLITSSADEEDDYFVVREGDEEEFRVVVNFNPEAADEEASYRMQLLTLRFNDSTDPPDDSWTASPASDYRTQGAFVSD